MGCSVEPFISNMASSSSDQFFDEEQRRQMNNLLYDIFYAQSCVEIDRAIDSNPILQELEEDYETRRGFLYDELSQFSNLGNWLKVSSPTSERFLTQGIVIAWLSREQTGTVRYVIDRVRRCRPRALY